MNNELIYTCDLKGGLGNQLFQICTTISLAKQNNGRFVFTNAISEGWRHKLYFNSLLNNIKDHVVESIPDLCVFEETSFNYTKPPDGISMRLNGYFQSYKYIDIDTIVEALGINVTQNDNVVGVHFRRGDYTALQDIHPVLPLSYYINAINNIKSKTNEVLTFMCIGEVDCVHIINELKNHFVWDTFIHVPPHSSDVEHFMLLLECQHHIIANSTFSWWGEYLSNGIKKTNNIVCYPSLWFGNTNDTSDLFPNTWTCVSIYTAYYINLKHRVDRNNEIQEELLKINLSARRINGIYTPDLGALGCTMSHIQVLQTFINSNEPYAVILEDDITFSVNPIPLIHKFMRDIPEWDVLFLAANPLAWCDENGYKRVQTSLTASAYVINKQYAKLLLTVFKKSMKLLKEKPYKPEYTCDTLWCLLQPIDKWYALYPLPGKQRESYSDTEKRVTNYGV